MVTLLSIPSDIFVYELCPYLSWSSLCTLDVAFTSRKLRPLLLEMYPLLRCGHAADGMDDVQLLWFVARGIPLPGLSFVPEITDSTLFFLASHWQDCASLTKLDLSYCRKTTDVSMIAVAQHCQQLRVLSLSYTYSRNATLEAFARSCHNITALDVSNCQLITDEAVQFLAQNCRVLTSLNISQCPVISYLSLQAIALHSTALATLNVCYCRVTARGILAISQGCPSLTSLDLSYSFKTIPLEAALACTTLTDLNLSNCWEICDDLLIAIARSSPLLCRLDLSDCQHVTDRAVTFLSEYCTLLTSLDLSHCDITDDAVIALVGTAATRAETGRGGGAILSLSLGNTDITNVSVTFIAYNCSALTFLNLASCCAITDAALQALARGCTTLQLLDIRGCDALTAEAVLSCFPQEWEEEPGRYRSNDASGRESDTIRTHVYW